jgi:hypothetical protein
MPLVPGSFSSKLFIEITGEPGGSVSSFRAPAREVGPIQALGPDSGLSKLPGKPLIGDARLTLSISESGPVFDWVAEAMRGTAVAKDVAIILANQDYKVTRRVEMRSCLITEINFPALDAGDKSSFQVGLILQPEDVASVKGSGVVVSSLPPKTKGWRASNFRVTLPWFDPRYVTRVELPKVTIKVATETHGSFRLPTRHYAAIEIKGLRTTHASQGIEAAEDVVTKLFADGVVDDSERGDITIEILDQTLRTVLATFTAAGSVPTRFDPPELKAAQDVLPVAQIQYAVESLAVERHDVVTL